MAIDFNKNLYRAGVGGSFGSGNTGKGVSSQTSKNLGSSTRSVSGSEYSLKNKKRTNFVPGQFVTKGANKPDYNKKVTEHNRRFTPSYTVGGGNTYGGYQMGGFPGAQQPSKFASFMQDLNAGMKTGAELYGFLNNIGLVGGGNVSSFSGDGGSISQMASCQDSVSLRGAISDAKSELSGMQASQASYDAAAEKAQDGMKSIKGNVDTSKSNLKTAKNEVGTAKNTVTACKNQRDNCLNAVDKADAEYGKTEHAYAEAHDKHQTASTNLKNATAAKERANSNLSQLKSNEPPKEIDVDGQKVPNPEHAKWEADVKTAEAKLHEAESKESQAKTAEDQAKTAEEQAKTAKETAYNNLGEKKAAVDKAKESLDKSQTKLDGAVENQGKAENNQNIAQEKYQQATEVLASAESAIEKAKVNKKNVEKLEKSIKSEEERLAKLEKQEQKQYDKYDSKAQKGIDKNNERNDKIFSGNYGTNKNGGNDASTVDTSRERHLSNKMSKTNDKVQGYNQKRDQYSSQVSETEYINNQLQNSDADFEVNGQSYREITTPSGQTLYYKDNQMISEEEYNKMKAASGANG